MLLDKGREYQHAIECVLDRWKDEVSEPCDYIVEFMVKRDDSFRKYYTKEILLYDKEQEKYMFLRSWLPEGCHAHIYESVPVHLVKFG